MHNPFIIDHGWMLFVPLSSYLDYLIIIRLSLWKFKSSSLLNDFDIWLLLDNSSKSNEVFY